MTREGISRRTFIKTGAYGFAGAALMGLAGCGQSGQSASSSGSGQRTIDITVTHYPTTFYGLPYSVGIEQGFFEEEGIEIGDILPGSGGGTTVRNILSGDLAFGDVASSAAIQANLSGAPLTIVGGAVRTYADAYYVTREDAPFETVQDLVGGSWAFTNPGSITQTTTQLIFEQEGIEPGAIETVAAGGLSEGLTLLEEGNVDATILQDPVYATEQDNYKTLFNMQEYFPEGLQQTFIVTNPQLVQDDPELIEGYLRAYQTSVDWIKQNPEEAGRIFAEGAEIAEEPSIEAVQKLIDVDHWSVGVNTEGTNTIIEGMQMVETLEEGQEVPWGEILNQDFLPEDQRVDVSTLNSGG